MACVVATLFVNGKPQGANGFLMRMRTADGKLVPGITIGDMGGKTVGNDLDNAWIRFTDVMLPKTALLNRYGLYPFLLTFSTHTHILMKYSINSDLLT